MRTYQPRQGVHAFAQEDLSEFLRARLASMAESIQNEEETYLLNVNREEYVQHIVDKFDLQELLVHVERMSATTEEMLIPAELYPYNYTVYSGKSYPRLVISYHVPFDGPARFLGMQASTFSTGTATIQVEGQAVRTDFIQFDQTPEQLSQEAKGFGERLVAGASRLNDDLRSFRKTSAAQAGQIFDARKQQLLQRRNFLEALNVPIRATGKTAATYSAPAPKKISPITPRPIVTEKFFRPDPTLDDVTYQQVLKIIHDVGITFEKLPSTYTGKDEEALRDHFLLALAPNFEGTATGETFNKTGKTDILLRHEKGNLFVAECKFWHGPKSVTETISQLLGYLTWRDSKSAVIFFVRNMNFSEVLVTLKQVVPTHSNYLGERPASSDTWLNFRFHINGDKNREVKVAALLFHLPPL